MQRRPMQETEEVIDSAMNKELNYNARSSGAAKRIIRYTLLRMKSWRGKSRGDTYRAAMENWARSDYILAHTRALYAVDGAKNCGPAYINDGFDKVNVYFSYNSDINCMEDQTTGLMLPGKYELLVNYDQPQYPSSY
jgi:hypothetical protein